MSKATELLTTTEAAEILGLTPSTILRRVYKRQVDYLQKTPKLVLLKRSDLSKIAEEK